MRGRCRRSGNGCGICASVAARARQWHAIFRICQSQPMIDGFSRPWPMFWHGLARSPGTRQFSGTAKWTARLSTRSAHALKFAMAMTSPVLAWGRAAVSGIQSTRRIAIGARLGLHLACLARVEPWPQREPGERLARVADAVGIHAGKGHAVVSCRRDGKFCLGSGETPITDRRRYIRRRGRGPKPRARAKRKGR